jgi:YHS domain-containing protein
MQLQDILYYLFLAGLFFVMMRYGCGSHIMGHSHHKTASEPDHGSGTSVPFAPLGHVTDPVCHTDIQTSAAKTSMYHGEIYYFCSQKCREQFEASPPQYVKENGVAVLEKEHHHGCF